MDLLGAGPRVQQRTQKSLCLRVQGGVAAATEGTQLCGLERWPKTSGSPTAQCAVCTPILSSPAEAEQARTAQTHALCLEPGLLEWAGSAGQWVPLSPRAPQGMHSSSTLRQIQLRRQVCPRKRPVQSQRCVSSSDGAASGRDGREINGHQPRAPCSLVTVGALLSGEETKALGDMEPDARLTQNPRKDTPTSGQDLFIWGPQ